MSSLIDRDATAEREKEYPSTAGAALKQIGLAGVELHTAATEAYLAWTEELLKRADVHYAIKLAILGGTDPLVFGGSLPSVMMAKLEALGVAEMTVEGSLNVGESNKANEGSNTSVGSQTTGGVGFGLWHVNEQLTVRHASHAEQTRSTDYRSKINWSVKMAPQGEPEGIGLIKEATADAYKLVQGINQAFVDAQAEKQKQEAKSPSESDAESFLSEHGGSDPDDTGDEGDDTGGEE